MAGLAGLVLALDQAGTPAPPAGIVATALDAAMADATQRPLQALASEARMSVQAFHVHFKTVTQTSSRTVTSSP